jgi:hypothetical protein
MSIHDDERESDDEREKRASSTPPSPIRASDATEHWGASSYAGKAKRSLIRTPSAFILAPLRTIGWILASGGSIHSCICIFRGSPTK